MGLSELIARFFGSGLTRGTSTSHSLIIGSSVLTTLAFVAVAQRTLQSDAPKTRPSPRSTQLPLLSKAEQEQLPYPPNVFPGARDVASPYGTIRVYEWGPQDGRKVLLVHGISTPCLALGGLAYALVERGCRVMLFDLWGRGYSDSVDLPHDDRLYTTEILLALTSSPLAWTPGGFSLIGYSLGGGIAADFASSFPNIVKSLVLLAPAGLIRHHHFGWQSRMMYSGIVPDNILRWIIDRRLRIPVNSNDRKLQSADSALGEEFQGARDYDFENSPLSKTRPDVTVASVVQWQVENHQGFVDSFVSSIKYASIEGKQETWRKLGLRSDKVLILVGKSDPLVIAGELDFDARQVIGDDKVDIKTIDAGHEFPITQGDYIAGEIGDFWDL